MADQRDREGKPCKMEKAGGRQARLEQALRANLLKRKARARGREGPAMPPEGTPPKEGGQG